MPSLSARISRPFLTFLVPGHGRIAPAMVDSPRNDTVVEKDGAHRASSIEPRNLAEAIRNALVAEDHEFARTRWSDALAPASASRWGGFRLVGDW